MEEYIREFDPSIVVLMETRISGYSVDCEIIKIGWLFSHRVEACEFSRGIWLCGRVILV